MTLQTFTLPRQLLDKLPDELWLMIDEQRKADFAPRVDAIDGDWGIAQVRPIRRVDPHQDSWCIFLDGQFIVTRVLFDRNRVWSIDTHYDLYKNIFLDNEHFFIGTRPAHQHYYF